MSRHLFCSAAASTSHLQLVRIWIKCEYNCDHSLSSARLTKSRKNCDARSSEKQLMRSWSSSEHFRGNVFKHKWKLEARPSVDSLGKKKPITASYFPRGPPIPLYPTLTLHLSLCLFELCQPRSHALINHWGWASTLLGSAHSAQTSSLTATARGGWSPSCAPALAQALGPCLAWMPTLHKPTLSTLHSSAPSTCVRVCSAGLHNPQLGDLLLLNELALWFMFISFILFFLSCSHPS